MKKKHLNPDAIRLLHEASFFRDGRFMCFGKYYLQLKNLDLIDDEYNVTFLGRKFLRHCMNEGFFNE